MAQAPVVYPENVARMQKGLFTRHASAVVLVTGLVFLLGTSIDFLTLWVFQRASGMQWEFVATTQTVEGIPRLILAFAFIYTALHLRRSSSIWLYRTLGAGLLVLGIVALAMGVLIAVNYVALAGAVNEEARAAFRIAVLKSGSLATLYIVTLVPLGILGLRKP